MEYIVTYLTAPGRCPLENAWCPSTDRKGADRVHQPFLQGPVHLSVMARNRLVTGNALSMPDSGYCHFIKLKIDQINRAEPAR